MSSGFRDFFPDKIAMAQEEERMISPRLPAFRAIAVDEDEAARLRKAATRTQWVKGVSVKEVDAEANMLSLVIACVRYPDLHDAQLQSAWSVVGAEALLKKILLPGEYAELSDWVARLCGFDQSMQELVDTAKN